MILVIDNYDSFVYNLVRYIEELGFKTIVRRNDVVSIEEISKISPSHIILSPGPCRPRDAGNILEIVKAFADLIPMLGVCLGHQAIAEVFGASIGYASEPMHGEVSLIHHKGTGVFSQIPSPVQVARYHSLIAQNLGSELVVDAYSEEGEVMAFRHQNNMLWGVQFHPESVLTDSGHLMIKNFLELTNLSA